MAEAELKLTETDVEDWIGSDNLPSKFIEILTEIANGEYEAAQLRSDIESYKETCPECDGTNLTEDKTRCWDCNGGPG